MPYYHELRFHLQTAYAPRCLKHEIPDITPETAFLLYLEDQDVGPAEIGALKRAFTGIVPIDEKKAKRYGTDKRTIQVHTPSGIYYTAPNGTVKALTLIRHNPDDDTQADLVDVVSLPGKVVNRDCDGQASMRLLRQIARDWLNSEQGRAKRADPDAPFTWADLTYVPSTFLWNYGVSIEPIDTMLTITVGTNEDLSAERKKEG